MTINDVSCGLVHLRRVAGCVSGIHSLPGIPTATWAESAAACVSRVLPGSLCAVRVVDRGGEGDVVLRVCAGAFDSDRRVSVDVGNLSVDHETASDWWLSAVPRTNGSSLSTQTGLLRAAPGRERWEFSTLGRRWASQGVTEILVGATPMDADTRTGRNRWAVVELGDKSDPTGLGNEDEAVMAAVLPELAHRAAIAFMGVGGNGVREVLTQREHEVLMLLAGGRTVKQIAEELARSPHTVHDHVKALHRKLGASSRGELVARALGHIDQTGRVAGVHHGASREPGAEKRAYSA